MEEYYKWQIEQLKATVAQQDEIIKMYAERDLQRLTEHNSHNSLMHSV